MNIKKRTFLIKIVKNEDKISGVIEDLNSKHKKNFENINDILFLINESFEEKEETK
ncbi:MAG TPA: hypothetical protein P5272_04140 [Caldisericia bacterium]|nr:hypothetical protein [Caldisericia bacterium]HOL83032.1 hypothetical protein [Caldisericia bacterium]HON83309.1 hypothetical protein [Caldisericia bacterium]HPC56958.1 hypothetical protein [Caldisericia bacterium]HPP43993.1 hypothetical protein [Caldisericia bacterium]